MAGHISSDSNTSDDITDVDHRTTPFRDVLLRTCDWRFRDDLTVDENFMDLAHVLTRNSRCAGGHMGCVLVRPPTAPSERDAVATSAALPASASAQFVLGRGPEECLGHTILAMSTNSPLFEVQPDVILIPISTILASAFLIFDPDSQRFASDVHAEVNALGLAAQRGCSTRGTTLYVTMPPCTQCYMVLQVLDSICKLPGIVNNGFAPFGFPRHMEFHELSRVIR
jgi:deoxycytidylate deaminase